MTMTMTMTMERSLTNNVHVCCSSLLMAPNVQSSKNPCLSLPSSHPHYGKLRIGGVQSWRKGNGQMLWWKEAKCCKGVSVSVPEKEKQFGDELIMTEEELMDLGRLGLGNNKCIEVRGIAELLECLEREAIMGDDLGKEPIDYNRRALIFDKSSRVFQALKHNNTIPSSLVDSS